MSQAVSQQETNGVPDNEQALRGRWAFRAAATSAIGAVSGRRSWSGVLEPCTTVLPINATTTTVAIGRQLSQCRGERCADRMFDQTVGRAGATPTVSETRRRAVASPEIPVRAESSTTKIGQCHR